MFSLGLFFDNGVIYLFITDQNGEYKSRFDVRITNNIPSISFCNLLRIA